METPPPVQITPQMQALLNRAKSVMKKVDNDKPIALSETTSKQIVKEESDKPAYDNTPRSPGGYTREQVMASNFPQPVKEAMLKSIPKQILEDTSELEDIKMTPNKRKPILKTINESRTTQKSDLITISKSELKTMIDESVIHILTQSYSKTLTNEAIKKTINMLISEGKLSIKKK